MGWYDFFSLFYDSALERLYRPHRAAAVERLQLGAGATVLDLACGTGQNFPALEEAIGPSGLLLGLDLSSGMLARAKRRAEKAGWQNVRPVERDARELDADGLAALTEGRALDGVLCTLGLSVIPDWQSVLEHTFALLRPGGRFAIVDVHAAERVFQTRLVELTARADLRRKVWEPLEALAVDFALVTLEDAPRTHGGRLFLASGTRPWA